MFNNKNIFGSVLGAILLVGGLYFVLWGKTKEEERIKREIQVPPFDVEEGIGCTSRN